jgi:hypothetical protein
MKVKFTDNERGNPVGKLADAELIFPALNEAEVAEFEKVLNVEYAESQIGPRAAQRAMRAALALSGCKLIGFAVWERKSGNGRNVTLPARQYSINGERRSFALLRPDSGSGHEASVYAQQRITEFILSEYAKHEEAAENERAKQAELNAV